MPNDRTNVFQLSSVYQLPFGNEKQYLTEGVAAAIAGGWQANAVLSFYSGSPFSVTDPGTSLNAPGSQQRANQVKRQVAVYGAHGLVSPYFDTSAFAPVTTPTFGTASFDSLRGPGFSNMDFVISRIFRLREWLNMRVPR